MSDFMNAASAVETIIMMLEEGGCKTVFARIFTDGSGSIVVDEDARDRAERLLKAHGLNLYGRERYGDEGRYHFTIDADVLKNYVEKPCPHCGRDTLGAAS